jgi:hypothetical protein
MQRLEVSGALGVKGLKKIFEWPPNFNFAFEKYYLIKLPYYSNIYSHVPFQFLTEIVVGRVAQSV